MFRIVEAAEESIGPAASAMAVFSEKISSYARLRGR
jgi:predicted ATP-grasp superfamily ATP-dependent carboligase